MVFGHYYWVLVPVEADGLAFAEADREWGLVVGNDRPLDSAAIAEVDPGSEVDPGRAVVAT